MACGVPLVATTGGALPEVVGTRRRDRPARAAGRPRRARRACCSRALGDAELRARIGAAGREPVLDRSRGARPPKAPSSTTARCSTSTRGAGRGADADRRLRPARASAPASACSTSGAAAAVTRSRRCGAARRSSRSTTDAPSSRTCATSCGAMVEAGELPPDAARAARSTATRSRCRSPTPRSTASSRRRCSSTSGPTSARSRELVRVLRPGGRMAVTVPTRARAGLLGARPPLPRHARRPRPHLPPARARGEARAARACALRGSHHAHALHSPYWWLKCAVGVDNADALAGAQVPRLPRVADRASSRAWLDAVDRALNPVLGKSLVVYTEKVGDVA